MITAKIKETHPLGSRVISIKSRKLNALSMQRALTVTEENYTTALKEARLPMPVFPHNIFEMRREFSIEKLNDMLKKTNSFQSVVKQVRPLATRNQSRLSVFRPIVKSISPINWVKTRAALEVGIFGGYDVIAVPDHHFSGIHAYEEYISKSRDHIYDASTSLKGDFECMPSISIANNRLDELKAKLKLFKNLGINAINVENAENAIHDFIKDKLTEISETAEPHSGIINNIKSTRERIFFPLLDNKGENSEISQHFGHAPFFGVYDVEKNNLEIIKNNLNHSDPNKSPIDQIEETVKPTTIYAKGIGGRAIKIIAQKGLALKTGDYNTVKEVIDNLDKLENQTENCGH